MLINGATAVPHRFYQRFASALAKAGYAVVSYDYRGVGASPPPSLRGFAARMRGFAARMRDWALPDMAGVVDWVAEEHAPRHKVPMRSGS